MKKIKLTLLDISIWLLVLLVCIYLASDCFRLLIKSMDIDAGLLSGFIASLALLFAIKQSVKDKKFAYNTSITSRINDASVFIIGKLLRLHNDSIIFVHTVEKIAECMRSNEVYSDVNNILGRMNLGEDSDKVASYIDIYFPTESENWNEILEIMSKVGSLASTIYGNYIHPDNQYGKVHNNVLSNIDEHLKTIHKLQMELGNKPQEMRNRIVDQINEQTLLMKKYTEL